ncbi:MAG: TRAFs-binding domain-containing protein [Chitinophagaceae bacterium]
MPAKKDNPKEPKRCFVVMGFGVKTDFATGRKLDLNKSYKVLIKPVVESKGLVCIRADEIQHSGSIDLYMYQELLNADIVIADLSTSNVNAFYELGIRHALRRRTTIIISEDKLGYPFDLNHIKITNYTHLGGAIDYEEVERFRKILGDTIDTVLNLDDPDSPVYTHLHDLIPPSLEKKAVNVAKELGKEIQRAITDHEASVSTEEMQKESTTLAVLVEQGEEAIKNKDFISAKAFFTAAIEKDKGEGNGSTILHNSYLIHRLVLATYKTQLPDKMSALKEAIKLLSRLDLENTNDPETVALAGKIEKRLFNYGQGDEHLNNAILFYERGYYLLRNRYNGINLAFLLNRRVDTNIYQNIEDKITDMVLANRIRREVLKMCKKEMEEIAEHNIREEKQAILQSDIKLSYEHIELENEQKFWIHVNKAEAHFGLGEMDEYKKADAKAREFEHTPFMLRAYEEEIDELRELMKKNGHLLNPVWKESSTPVSETVK